MTGDHERHEFVADLAQWDRRIAFESRDEQAEKVGARLGFSQASLHHVEHRLVEFASGASQRALRGGPGRQRDRHLRRRHHDIERLERGPRESVGVGGEVSAEERRCHGLERDAHHGLVDVDHRAARDVAPSREEFLGGYCGMANDGLQARPVEGRLDHAPLPPPDVTGRREQALASHQREGPVLHGGLVVGAGAVHEDPPHGHGIRHEIRRRRGNGELHDWPMGACHLLQEPQRIAANGAQVRQHLRPRRTGCRRRGAEVTAIGDPVARDRFRLVERHARSLRPGIAPMACARCARGGRMDP